MEPDELWSVLDAWNPWNQDIDTGIERPHYLHQLTSYMRRPEVVVIKGIRRSGKSTLVKQLMHRLTQQGVPAERLLYLNLEDHALADHLSTDLLQQALDVHEQQFPATEKRYFFIDEIQFIDGWERFIRTKYDQQTPIKFIVTGSNASLLSQELSTLLTGRNLTLEVRPLHYTEYQQFARHPRIGEYLLYGGFPEVVLEEDEQLKKTLLTQYFEDILYKDVIARRNIRNPQDIIKLARYLVDNSGTPFSIHNLANALDISNKTIDTYLGYLRDAYLFSRIDHFSYSARKRYDKRTQPKYYVADNGFSHAITTFTKDDGQRFENAVLHALLLESTEIMHWRDGEEVDFIHKDRALNVTWESTEVPEREYDALRAFTKTHTQYTPVLVTPRSVTDAPPDIEPITFNELCEQTMRRG